MQNIPWFGPLKCEDLLLFCNLNRKFKFFDLDFYLDETRHWMTITWSLESCVTKFFTLITNENSIVCTRKCCGVTIQ